MSASEWLDWFDPLGGVPLLLFCVLLLAGFVYDRVVRWLNDGEE